MNDLRQMMAQSAAQGNQQVAQAQPQQPNPQQMLMLQKMLAMKGAGLSGQRPQGMSPRTAKPNGAQRMAQGLAGSGKIKSIKIDFEGTADEQGGV